MRLSEVTLETPQQLVPSELGALFGPALALPARIESEDLRENPDPPNIHKNAVFPLYIFFFLVGGFNHLQKYQSVGMVIPNIWKSVGVTIPSIWKNTTCSKPPT